MRPEASRFYLGQLVRVQVVEVQSDGYVLVGLQGALLQILNQTGQTVTVGQTLNLKVTSVNPPKFQLQIPQPGRMNWLV